VGVLRSCATGLILGIVVGGASAGAQNTDSSSPTLLDVVNEVSTADGELTGSPARTDNDAPPTDFETGEVDVDRVGTSVDASFLEHALIDMPDGVTPPDFFGFVTCEGSVGALTYVCMGNDPPNFGEVNQVFVVHLGLAGTFADTTDELGVALLMQIGGRAQAPAGTALAGASAAFRTIVGQPAQMFQFPWTPVPPESDATQFLQILHDDGSVTWILDPTYLGEYGVTGFNVHPFLSGTPVADPIPGAGTFLPFDVAGFPVLALTTDGVGPAPVVPVPGAPAADVADGGDGGAFPLLPVLGGGVVLVAAGAAGTYMLRRRPDLPPATVTALQREFGGAAEAEAAFTTALLEEAPIQRRLIGQYNNVVQPWVAAQQRFSTASLTYAETYQTTLRGSTELQELAQHWAEARGAAQWVDLAYGLATIGPGLVRLGVGGARRFGGLFGLTDDAAKVAARSAARAAINNSDALRALATEADDAAARIGSRFTPSDVLEECVMLADEAGVPVEQFVTTRVNAVREAYDALRAAGSAGPKDGSTMLDVAFSKVWCDLAELVMKKRGWQALPADVGNVMSDAVGGLHVALRGDFGLGQSTRLHETFTRLAELAKTRPNFWEWLGKTYEVIGGPTSWDTYVTPAFSAADLAMARWAADMLGAGHKVDELAGLWVQHLGPVGSTGWQAAQGAGITIRAGVVGAADGSAIPELVGTSTEYLDQFGIISPTFLFWDAGDSAIKYFGFNVLNFYLGPAEWMTNAWSTVEAMDAYEAFTKRYGDEITTMSVAAVDVLGSLDALTDVLQGPGISADDRHQLRDVRDTLQQSYANTSTEFRTANAQVLADRVVHIDQKLAQLDGVMATLTQAATLLFQVRGAIDAEVHGSRSGVGWVDPDIAMTFARTSLMIETFAIGILGAPAPPAVERERPKVDPMPFLEQRARELDAEPTDEEESPDLDLGAAGRAWDRQARGEQGDIEHRDR
jgi:hypothetical protein